MLVSRASTNTRCLPNRIGISWAAPLSLHGDVVPDVCVDRAGAIGVDSMSVQSLLVADTTSRNNVLSYCMLEQHKVQTISGFKGHMFGGGRFMNSSAGVSEFRFASEFSGGTKFSAPTAPESRVRCDSQRACHDERGSVFSAPEVMWGEVGRRLCLVLLFLYSNVLRAAAL